MSDDLPGVDAFTGHKIYCTRWDHSYEPAGKRVAVICTGAGGVRLIPELVGRASSVKVFQRTPGWVLPRMDQLLRCPAARTAARQSWFWGLVWNSGFATAVEAVARAHLRLQVKDPWMRRQLTPDYRADYRSLLMTSDYYPALQRENCKLITWPIATLAPDGIRTADGIEHQVDCIIFALDEHRRIP